MIHFCVIEIVLRYSNIFRHFQVLFCHNDPESHPFISKKEREYLKSEISQLKHNNELPPTPWKQIFISTPVCALLVSQVHLFPKHLKAHWMTISKSLPQFGFDCLSATLFTYLPKYMKEVLGFTAHEIGLYTSIPSLLTWIGSIAFGVLCDHLINQRHLTTVQARKFFTAFCM